MTDAPDIRALPPDDVRCTNCGGPGDPSRHDTPHFTHGRCGKCYVYWKRNGVERPRVLRPRYWPTPIALEDVPDDPSPRAAAARAVVALALGVRLV